MKKVFMLISLLVVMIVPTNFCAAKNYVYVYPDGWNEFIDELKKIVLKPM